MYIFTYTILLLLLQHLHIILRAASGPVRKKINSLGMIFMREHV
jgi:hypothetical protein